MIINTNTGGLTVNSGENLNLCGIPVKHTISVGNLTLGVLLGELNTDDLYENEIIPLIIDDKQIREIMNKNHAVFVQAVERKSRPRPAIMISYMEDEKDYKIDRLVQNFIAHGFYIDDTRVDIYGSDYPEMYQTIVPKLRVFATNKKDGTIKEACFVGDYDTPLIKYVYPDEPRYKILANYKKSTFVALHNGNRFVNRMPVKPFVKFMMTAEGYKKRRDEASKQGKQLNVYDVINGIFCGGMPKNPDAIPIFIGDPYDMDDIEDTIKTNGDYSDKGPLWYLIGFDYADSIRIREFIQKLQKNNNN